MEVKGKSVFWGVNAFPLIMQVSPTPEVGTIVNLSGMQKDDLDGEWKVVKRVKTTITIERVLLKKPKKKRKANGWR